MLADGKRQILSFHIPGDYLPLQGVCGQPLTFSVRTLTEVHDELPCDRDLAILLAWLRADNARTSDQLAAFTAGLVVARVEAEPHGRRTGWRTTRKVLRSLT